MTNRKQKQIDCVLKKLNQVSGIDLPGIEDPNRKYVFVQQVVDSIRRIEYVQHLSHTKLDALRANPYSELFDPLKAAVINIREGENDEAFWLLFLATHFGKAHAYGWGIVADVYGGRGECDIWTWDNITENFSDFDTWFKRASVDISNEKEKLKFNNHRKYQSFRYDTACSVPKVIKSYLDFVGAHHSHAAKIAEAEYATGNDNTLMFDYFYKGMKKNVKSFSRLGIFDLLTMWSKLNLVDFYPQYAYIAGSTGPRPGATLLFYGYESGIGAKTLESKLAELSDQMSLGPLAMQVLEDSLCNWQKSPDRYKLFRG